jgi:xanthine dehydrogenase YagT iron-sulfur-binding subunit
MTEAEVTMRVNGVSRIQLIDPRMSLLDLLRERLGERLGLTGAKKGSDHGQCGACTVLIDGRRANACLALAVAQEGAEITTIEDLTADPPLTPGEIRERMSGNLCRCGAYVNIVRAITAVTGR